MSEKTFNPDEVRQILDLAIEEQQAGGDGMTQGELVAAVRELGVGADQIERAIVALERRGPVQAEVARMQTRRMRRLQSHTVTFALVHLMLFGVNLLTGGPWWFFWPLLGWGLGLALHAKGVFMADADRDERKAEQRLAKREQQALRAARREQRQQALEELVGKVGDGALAVATTISEKIEEEMGSRRGIKGKTSRRGWRGRTPPW